MLKKGKIIVFGEMDDSHLSSLTIQLMSAGKTLCSEMKEELHLILLGVSSEQSLSEGFGYGADRIFIDDNPLLMDYTTDGYLLAMEHAVNKLEPSIILFAQSDKGMDLAPRLAFRLKSCATMGCIDLKIDPEDGSVVLTKPVFGGKAHMKCTPVVDKPLVVSLREGVFDPVDYDDSRSGDTEDLHCSLDPSLIRTRFIKKEEDRDIALALKLADSNIVVCGGRGLKGHDGVAIIKETAGLLDGAIAGSRPAIDYGWIPSSLQVGLTGKKVSPQAYIAVGVSGALQHMAGCSKSKTILAINSDKEAPIFQLSHYGVVGDYREILSGFNDELRRIREVKNAI